MIGVRALSFGLLISLTSAFVSPAPAATTYVQTGFLDSPGDAEQLIYSSTYRKLVMRNSGRAMRVLDLGSGATATHLATGRFTDMSLTPDGRYVYVADFGSANISSQTSQNYIARLDLATGDWQAKPTSAVAYHIEAIDSDQLILTSNDQWIQLFLASWGTGASTTAIGNPNGSFFSLYQGDVEYDVASARLIHGNSGLSSRQITALRLTATSFVKQEESAPYGTAQEFGGSAVLATDSSAFYYGRLQVNPLDVRSNRVTFPEMIVAANAETAFSSSRYYGAATGELAGSFGFLARAFGLNRVGGDDFWVYDATTNKLRHFENVLTAPQPTPGPHADTVVTGVNTPVVIDVLRNDTASIAPISVSIGVPPVHGTATVVGSPGAASSIRISYRPTEGYSGSDTFEYRVDDGTHVGTAGVGVVIDAYRAANDSYVVAKGSCCSPTLAIGANDFGFVNPVTVRLASSPDQGGSASINGSPGNRSQINVSYRPSSSNLSNDYTESFTYEITDGVRRDVATVVVRVVNFLAQDDAISTPVDTPVAIRVGANDIGFGLPTIVDIFAAPVTGTVVVSNTTSNVTTATITYTPYPGFVGDVAFRYAVDDGTRVGIAEVVVHVINDDDRDTVPDEIDNCLNAANASQLDGDTDGYGNTCDADLDNNGRVNFADLAIFHQRFGTSDAAADFDGSGLVNFADLARMRAAFGTSPGPSALR